MNTIKLELPVLDGLDLKLEPTVLKLVEEVGELSQVVGKYRKLSNETFYNYTEETIKSKLEEELIDVAQTVCSLIYILERDYGINIKNGINDHIRKLQKKGYIK